MFIEPLFKQFRGNCIKEYRKYQKEYYAVFPLSCDYRLLQPQISAYLDFCGLIDIMLEEFLHMKRIIYNNCGTDCAADIEAIQAKTHIRERVDVDLS